MNWTKEGRIDRFRYVKVSWPDMQEVGEVRGITQATIKENTLATLKVSGTLEYVETLDIGEDLLRIYSISELEGVTHTLCHGTFFVTSPGFSWTGTTRAGKADMYSVLWILQQNKTTEVLSAYAGVNAVTLAAELARGYGNNLRVIETPSEATLNASHSWDVGTSYLEIINWLLDFAGYNSATVDAYGNVLMTPYTDPANKTTSVVFSDTGISVSEPGFTQEIDTFEVPNQVTLICSNAERVPLVAKATNDDPENPYSTLSRRKTLTRVERVSDVSSQEALEAKAQTLLHTALSVVEAIEIKHSYQPFVVGDAIRVDYTRAGYSKKLISVAREIQLIPGMRCTTRARRFTNLLKGT